jgi:hypothetical protein
LYSKTPLLIVLKMLVSTPPSLAGNFLTGALKRTQPRAPSCLNPALLEGKPGMKALFNRRRVNDVKAIDWSQPPFVNFEWANSLLGKWNKIDDENLFFTQ